MMFDTMTPDGRKSLENIDKSLENVQFIGEQRNSITPTPDKKDA